MAAFKKPDYFDMLAKGAGFALKAAKKFRELTCGLVSSEHIAAIEKVERDADRHMRLMSSYLYAAFITPIDRDDIYEIAKKVDDITGSIDAITNKLWMVNITRVNPQMKTMAEYIVNACEKVAELMLEMKNYKKKNSIGKKAEEINEINKAGNKCYRAAVRELFMKERDPIYLIKTKEIYEGLKDVIDTCGSAADCVHTILITKT